MPSVLFLGALQLEAFLGHWRAHLRPAHGLVFSQLNGAPLTAQGLHKLFYSSAFRITGKKTNPHLVRDMVVTHLRCAACPAPPAPAHEVGGCISDGEPGPPPLLCHVPGAVGTHAWTEWSSTICLHACQALLIA